MSILSVVRQFWVEGGYQTTTFFFGGVLTVWNVQVDTQQHYSGTTVLVLVIPCSSTWYTTAKCSAPQHSTQYELISRCRDDGDAGADGVDGDHKQDAEDVLLGSREVVVVRVQKHVSASQTQSEHLQTSPSTTQHNTTRHRHSTTRHEGVKRQVNNLQSSISSR